MPFFLIRHHASLRPNICLCHQIRHAICLQAFATCGTLLLLVVVRKQGGGKRTSQTRFMVRQEEKEKKISLRVVYCQRGVIRNQSCFSPSPRLSAPPTLSYDLDPGLCQVPQSAEQDRIFPCGLLVCGSRPYGDPALINLLEQPYHHRGLLLGHKHKQREHVCVCRGQDLAMHVRRKPHCFLHRRKKHFFKTLSLRYWAAVLALSIVWVAIAETNAPLHFLRSSARALVPVKPWSRSACHSSPQTPSKAFPAPYSLVTFVLTSFLSSHRSQQ